MKKLLEGERGGGGEGGGEGGAGVVDTHRLCV